MRVILVTGCLGFIGSNFVMRMMSLYKDIRMINIDKITYAGNLDNLKSVESDSRYKFIRGDICDKDLVASTLERYDPDIVINFAAESHVDRSITGPDEFAKTNVMGTLNMLQCCKKAWYDDVRGEWRSDKKYLQVSTDEVYGSLGDTGLFTEETPIDPHSPYSASKASADLFVKAFYDTWGMPVNITRCSNNYGPRQFPEKLIPLMINNARSHKRLPVYGDGLQIRDWLHVYDHCDAIDLVAKKGVAGRVYNIGGSNELPNIDIVKTIIAELSHYLKDQEINDELIMYVEDRPGHDRRYGIDSSLIRSELGWEPKISFESGIKETIAWYVRNQDWLDRVASGEYKNYYEKMYERNDKQREASM